MTTLISDATSPPASVSAVSRQHTSRFRGVLWDKCRNKWAARITVDDQCRSLGRFDDEIEAAKAYDAAAREFHGEIARFNFPTDAEREHAARWMERPEVCRAFQISLPTIKKWEKLGLIPKRSLGHGKRSQWRILYDVEEIKRLLPELGPVQPPYPDPERPGCYRVPLVAQRRRGRPGEAIIDADSLLLVQGNRFYLNSAYGGKLATVELSRRGECTPLHRLILGVTDRALEVKHVNGDPLDCRRGNLVLKTFAEKVHGNQKMGTLNGVQYTSRFKGVCWDKDRELWLVQIRSGGKGRIVGRFEDEAHAALAYDEAARELFGEHAWLNFPGEGERGRQNQQDAAAQSQPPVRMAA